MESDALARETAEAVARRSYGKLVALLAALLVAGWVWREFRVVFGS